MQRGNCLIGVDLGTTGTKAALIREDGTVLAEAHVPSRLIQPRPGHVEQDPEEMLQSAVDTIRQVMEAAGVEPAEVAGLALSGQMAGILLIDDEWNPVTPYDSWLDTRCDPYVAAMRPEAERIIAACGGPPTYSHGPKLLWWKNEHPEVFRRAAKFVMPAAYVAGRLTGLKAEQAFIDWTYVHFSCLADLREARWSDELSQLFGIPSDKLPRIVRPWEVVGRLTGDGARATGLLEGTPVVAGAGDQAAAMLGAGIVRVGMVYDSGGTASVMAACVSQFAPDRDSQTLLTARMVPADLWYAIGYINGGGLNLKWFRDHLNEFRGTGDEVDYPALDARAAEVPPGSEGLLFVPHLGGRVCPNEPHISGAWIGLTWSHGWAHMYRAMLESVAYEYAIYLDIERRLAGDTVFTEVRAVGGGSRSPLWNQIKADVLGIPYVQLNRPEVGALGTAILAGFGVGVFDDWEAAVNRFIWEVRRYEPDPEATRRYREYVAAYRELLEEHRPLWERVSRLRRP